jgi:hypothetical protein
MNPPQGVDRWENNDASSKQDSNNRLSVKLKRERCRSTQRAASISSQAVPSTLPSQRIVFCVLRPSFFAHEIASVSLGSFAQCIATLCFYHIGMHGFDIKLAIDLVGDNRIAGETEDHLAPQSWIISTRISAVVVAIINASCEAVWSPFEKIFTRVFSDSGRSGGHAHSRADCKSARLPVGTMRHSSPPHSSSASNRRPTSLRFYRPILRLPANYSVFETSPRRPEFVYPISRHHRASVLSLETLAGRL